MFHACHDLECLPWAMAGRCNSKMPVNFLTDGQDAMRHAIGGNEAAARPVKTFSVGAVGAVTRLQSESTPISSSALYSVHSRPITQQRLKSRRGAVSSELSILPSSMLPR
ncbi:hypothetical protein E4U13_005509 [Claviceps humidiphila]|uniref:Uncharacterized protein n=1 Tax=Claviceps humidiphila TaxID=1294629 RepID=A0A9P7Q6D4_9HYPO|nr:hypothetical protein E4U13_005509 [Claviceps humidiphila]